MTWNVHDETENGLSWIHEFYGDKKVEGVIRKILEAQP